VSVVGGSVSSSGRFSEGGSWWCLLSVLRLCPSMIHIFTCLWLYSCS